MAKAVAVLGRAVLRLAVLGGRGFGRAVLLGDLRIHLGHTSDWSGAKGSGKVRLSTEEEGPLGLVRGEGV